MNPNLKRLEAAVDAAHRGLNAAFNAAFPVGAEVSWQYGGSTTRQALLSTTTTSANHCPKCA